MWKISSDLLNEIMKVIMDQPAGRVFDLLKKIEAEIKPCECGKKDQAPAEDEKAVKENA